MGGLEFLLESTLQVCESSRRIMRLLFLYIENHSLGEWFQRRLVPMMETKKLLLL